MTAAGGAGGCGGASAGATSPGAGRPGAGRPRRSLLFVPADRPDRVRKAAGLPADVVTVDLEDAVEPGRKAAARSELGRLLAETDFGRREVAVRINSPATWFGVADLLAVRDFPRPPDLVVLPKVESAGEVRTVGRLLDEWGAEVALLPILESAAGILAAPAIAAAHPRVAAVLFGGADLSAELGARMEWEALLGARQQVVLAAAAAGVAAIDVPYLDFKDLEGLGREAARARALGFGGKGAIHPGQLETINRAFTPEAAEVARAERILAAVAAQGAGAIAVDGRMVDPAVVKQAERIVALARAVGAAPSGGAGSRGADPAGEGRAVVS